MKKVGLCIIFAISLILLWGCEGRRTDKEGILIVTTVYPPYDIATEVCGENAEIIMLVPPGSESHTYEPSAKDMINISDCDLFIYGGGESDTWVDKILDSVGKEINTLKMMDCVELCRDHSHDHHHDQYDEHVWTSPVNVMHIAEALCDEMGRIAPELSEDFEENTERYIGELEQLDEEFREFFRANPDFIMVFGDRFPFLYFAEEYGVEYYSAYPGCSAETEASPATIASLIDLVKEKQISTVFHIEFSNTRIAQTIAQEGGADMKLFHSCHNVSEEEIKAGVSYLSLMKGNLETLKGAVS